MAVNKFMHPRNRYRQKPNIQELVKHYPELNQVATVDLSGKVKLDFKSEQSVQLLSKCLLLRDFGLKMELPSDKLVPTLPLRLNYIHWLEDIGATVGWQAKESVKGIDIGCGASCIYPLLAVVQSNRRWRMVAIEKSEDSIQSAKANVIRNELQTFIDVQSQAAGGNTILLEVLQNFPNEQFDFCMCNPPFYDSASASQPYNRTGKRRKPPNACTGSGEELSTEGGEVNFISRIIEESFQLKDRISVYTTMIGHKKSYEEILRRFKSAGIDNTTVSRFCQGNTTRWAVAWSFDNKVLLSDVSNNLAEQTHSNLPDRQQRTIEWRIFTEREVSSLKKAKQYLEGILHSIAVNVRTMSEGSDEVICELIADQNTWSHQRRKRRSKLHSSDQEESASAIDSYHANNSDTKRPKLEKEQQQHESPFLMAAIHLHRKNNDYFLALQYVEGVAGRDSVNQILQFIQNKVKALPITQLNVDESS